VQVFTLDSLADSVTSRKLKVFPEEGPTNGKAPGTREIRFHPTYGGATIILPESEDGLPPILGTAEGQEIIRRSRDGIYVRVISPKHLFFLLEERHEVEGVGLYKRKYAFGAHENFHANELSASSLELLIETVKERTLELQSRAIHRERLKYFHVYAATDGEQLVGSLLATESIAPHMLHEIQELSGYANYKNKGVGLQNICEYCEMVKQEQDLFTNEESRVVFVDGYKHGFIGFGPFSPPNKYSLSIYPLKHVSTLEELSSEQTRILAQRIYESVSVVMINKYIKANDLNPVDIIFYSVPIDMNEKNDDFSLKNYHFHVGVSVARPDVNGSYKIPGTGWSVIRGRPKDTAKEFREILANLRPSNHQP